MCDPPHGQETLDRISPFGMYEKQNCRWADRWVQASNKRDSKLIHLYSEGRSIAEGTAPEWARWFTRQSEFLNLGQFAPWTAARLHSCLKVLTLGQIVSLFSMHPWETIGDIQETPRVRSAASQERRRVMDEEINVLEAEEFAIRESRRKAEIEARANELLAERAAA